MTFRPRSQEPLRESNVVRRGRYNLILNQEPGLLSGEAQPAPGGDALPPEVDLRYLYAQVKAYTDAHPGDFANHCVSQGGSFAFLDGLVANLQGIDARVGFCFRPERNNFAADALCYYHGLAPPVDGSHNVYVVDVIASSCSPQAKAAWNDVSSPAHIREWRASR